MKEESHFVKNTTTISFQFWTCASLPLFHAFHSKSISRNYVRNSGSDISFPIFIRKEIETIKLERKSKQQISRLIDLLYRLNDIISRLIISFKRYNKSLNRFEIEWKLKQENQNGH